MKRSVSLIVGIVILLISVACVFEGLVTYFATFDWSRVSVILGTNPQDCETLKFTIYVPDVVYVTVDDIDFSCLWLESGSWNETICTGPYFSLEPELTVKIHEGKGNQEPKKIISIPNQRPWDRCDYDGDGAVDAEDSCPEDPEIWICACDVGDEDMDSDGVPDCIDNCPEDPEKTEPGLCGCGIGDSDNDGMPDCLDECPADPAKEAPEQCGCGEEETDTDRDWVADCVDQCPDNPQKSEPGICGCGVTDEDIDGDGMIWCEDPCPGDAWHDTVGEPCDHDEDGDGITDNADGCPFDPKKTSPGSCGCGKPETGCGVPH